MRIKIATENSIITVLSCYAPQVELDNAIKDAFYDILNSTVNNVSAAETLVIYSDFNSHVGKVANGYEGEHGAQGYGLRSTEGERLHEFAVAHYPIVGNTHFHISITQVVTVAK